MGALRGHTLMTSDLLRFFEQSTYPCTVLKAGAETRKEKSQPNQSHGDTNLIKSQSELFRIKNFLVT